jgi:hypothetical protein
VEKENQKLKKLKGPRLKVLWAIKKGLKSVCIVRIRILRIGSKSKNKVKSLTKIGLLFIKNPLFKFSSKTKNIQYLESISTTIN